MTLRLVVAVLALGVLSACTEKKCDATSCSTGCCDASGTCVQALSASACGSGGSQCVACPATQVCQAGFCAPAGVGGGGGGSGGGAGGGGGGGGGGSSTSLRELVRQVYGAYCGYMARCGRIETTEVASCVDVYSASGASLTAAANATQAANIGFLGDYTQCISDFTTLPCDGSTPTSCGSAPVPVGRVANGGACVASPFECADPNASCAGATCPKTCQIVALGGNGQPCRRTGTACNTGLFCTTSAVCEALRPGGASCDSGSQCQSSVCQLGACLTLPGAGQPCDTTYPYCQAGLWCSSGTNTCQTSKQQGASCIGFTNECTAPLACVRGTCAQPGGVGARCEFYSDCASSLECDRVLTTCQERVTVDAGQPCTGYARDCHYQERCQGASVNGDGGVGALGVCARPVIGSTCSVSWDCPQASFCDGTGHCAAATTGSACSGDSNCLAGDYCSSSTRTCTPRFASGAQCDSQASSSCLVATELCTQTPGDMTWRCRARAPLGQPCVTSTDCKGIAACVGQVCVAAGHSGQPCFSGYCVDGACGADGGCQGAGGLDAGCFDYTHCASGVCLGLHCVSAVCQ